MSEYEFQKLVAQMRREQRAFFKTREYRHLGQAKALELKVDEQLRAYGFTI